MVSENPRIDKIYYIQDSLHVLFQRNLVHSDYFIMYTEIPAKGARWPGSARARGAASRTCCPVNLWRPGQPVEDLPVAMGK
eukprot:COSAG01_NODE_26253_length_719_cov_17.891935_1_plen_80_part_10